MEENQYVIISKTALQKRIEELESKIIPNPNFDSEIDSHNLLFIAKQNELNKILSKSTPLIPEIKKAINSGIRSFESNAYEMPELIEEIKQDYISNLKLDI